MVDATFAEHTHIALSTLSDFGQCEQGFIGSKKNACIFHVFCHTIVIKELLNAAPPQLETLKWQHKHKKGARRVTVIRHHQQKLYKPVGDMKVTQAWKQSMW